MNNLQSQGPKETQAIASELARRLRPGSIVALTGPLGAGKTCFVQGVAAGLKVNSRSRVNSPTFTILNIYEGKVPLYHFDFYRLSQETELADLGIEEYFFGEGITIIEWAEKFPGILPKGTIYVELKFIDGNTREIRFKGVK